VPAVVAKLGAHDVHATGISGKQVQTLTQLAIDASWDGTAGKLAMTAAQSDGGALKLVATGNPRALAAATATIDATRLDLEPITAFAPGVVAGVSGRLDAKLRAQGLDPRTAQITGTLQMTDARIPIAPTVGTLRKADVKIAIDPHEMTIDVDGRLGGGSVKLTGTAIVDGAAIGSADLKAKLTKVSPIGAVEPVIDADVTAKLKRNDNRWLADVTIDHGNINVPSNKGEKLSDVGPPPDMRFVREPRNPGAPPHVPDQPVLLADVTLNATNVKSDEVRGIIKGKVTIIASAQDVGLDGTIEADRGNLDLFGRRYQVERAAVHFDGTTDPILDVRITHDFTDVTTVTEVHGRLSKPTLVMTSAPATYSQGQLLGFLLGGEPGGDPSSGSMKDTATSTGASLVAGQLAGYVKKALPVSLDVLRYEAATASSSSAITVGKWLTNSLFVSYRQHLEVRPDENNGEVSLEYWLARQFALEGVAGDRGVMGADLLWRRRW
jgi:translocation and assembly module TamB